MDGIIVFVKNPKLGHVKTRIARTEGDARALEIYLQLLDHTRSVLDELDSVKKYVFYSEFIDNDDAWDNDLYHKQLQYEGDLGDRMKEAFRVVLQENKRALIIGSDCAQLSPAHIRRAYKELDATDLVIGPSIDGGYYLLGMKEESTFVFEDIPWSTSEVLGLTKAKAMANNKTIVEIETLSDIDYIEDWNSYGLPPKKVQNDG